MTNYVQNHIAADTASSMCLNFGVKNFSLISSALIFITLSLLPVDEANEDTISAFKETDAAVDLSVSFFFLSQTLL